MKVSHSVWGGAVGKVLVKATRWRPTLPHVRCAPGEKPEALQPEAYLSVYIYDELCEFMLVHVPTVIRSIDVKILFGFVTPVFTFAVRRRFLPEGVILVSVLGLDL